MKPEDLIQALQFITLELSVALGESHGETARTCTLREAMLFYAGQKSEPMVDKVAPADDGANDAFHFQMQQMVND